MSALFGHDWDRPDQITLNEKDLLLDQEYYYFIFGEMEKLFKDLTPKKLNAYQMSEEFGKYFPFVDVNQITFLVYLNKSNGVSVDRSFLERIPSILLQTPFTTFNAKYFSSGFESLCGYMSTTISIIQATVGERNDFILRRVYDALARKKSVPGLKKILTALNDLEPIILTRVDPRDLKTISRINVLKVSLGPAKQFVEYIIGIIKGNSQVSLPIFPGMEEYRKKLLAPDRPLQKPSISPASAVHPPVPEDNGGSNYGESASEDLNYADSYHKFIHIPDINTFDGGYLVKDGARRYMNSIEKYKNDSTTVAGSEYISKQYLPRSRQYMDISGALKDRAQHAYRELTLDPGNVDYFKECEMDLAMFEGQEFVSEILANPKPGAPLGYEKIDNSYQFEQCVVEFTVTRREQNERVLVGLPVRNTVPLTTQIFKRNASGPECEPIEITKVILSDPDSISNWQKSNSSFNIDALRYLQELEKSLERAPLKWKDNSGLTSRAFEEDNVSQIVKNPVKGSFRFEKKKVDFSITANVIELPQINGWQNPNILRKMNFDLSFYHHEMLPLSVTITISGDIQLVWNIHRFVPGKNYTMHLAVTSKNHSLVNAPKNKEFKISDHKCTPIHKALIDNECIKKYDDYMLHLLHVHGASQVKEGDYEFFNETVSMGYTYHYNHWTVIGTSVLLPDDITYETFYTLIHWTNNHANYRRSAHGGSNGSGGRKMIENGGVGQGGSGSARIRLLEDSISLMAARINELQMMPKLNVPRFDEHGGPWFIPGILNPSSSANNYGSVYFDGVDSKLHKQMMDEKRRQFESIVMGEFYPNLIENAEKECRGNLNVAIANYIKANSPKDQLIPSFPGLMGTFLKTHASEPARRRWSKLFTDFFDEHAEIAPAWRQKWSVYGREPKALQDYMKIHAEEKSRRKMFQDRGGGGKQHHYGRGMDVFRGYRGGERGGFNSGGESRGRGGFRGGRGGRGGYNDGVHREYRGNRRLEGGGLPASETVVWDKTNSEGVLPPRPVSDKDRPDGIEYKRSQYQDIFENHFQGEPRAMGRRGKGRGRSAAYNSFQVNPDDVSAYRPNPGTGSEVEDLRRTVNRLALENMSLHQMSSS